jgi:prolipoprotein diacylglyceryltransferase
MFPPIVHVALETLAFALGGLLYWRSSNASKLPLDRWTRWAVLAGAALGAALGSRGLYILQYWGALTHEPPAIWLGGKTIVGGLLGAVVGVETAKRAVNWTASTGDGFVLPLLVAIVIGRIGCQLSGLSDLTYGNVTTLPWAARSSASRGTRAFYRGTAGHCIRRGRIVMRKIAIIGAFLAGLVGLLMSVCGGGFFLLIGYQAAKGIFQEGQQGLMVGALNSLAIPAVFAGVGAFLFWACFKFIRRRIAERRENNVAR